MQFILGTSLWTGEARRIPSGLQSTEVSGSLARGPPWRARCVSLLPRTSQLAFLSWAVWKPNTRSLIWVMAGEICRAPRRMCKWYVVLYMLVCLFLCPKGDKWYILSSSFSLRTVAAPEVFWAQWVPFVTPYQAALPCFFQIFKAKNLWNPQNLLLKAFGPSQMNPEPQPGVRKQGILFFSVYIISYWVNTLAKSPRQLLAWQCLI